MKSLSPNRGGPAPTNDLEARIAQLDARLRQARMENESIRSRVEPSPAQQTQSATTNNREAAGPAAAAKYEQQHLGSATERGDRASSPVTQGAASSPSAAPPNSRYAAPAGTISSRTRASSPSALAPSTTLGATGISAVSSKRVSPPNPNPNPYPSLYPPVSTTSPAAAVTQLGRNPSPPGSVRSPLLLGPQSPSRLSGAASSPWRSVTARTLDAQNRELTVVAARHTSLSNNMARQIADKNEELAATNVALAETNSELTNQERRKNVVVAETQRQVQTAEQRVRDLDQSRAVNNATIAELQSRKNALHRQFEETKLGIASANARSVELEKQQVQLEGRLKELTAALRERERGITEENEQHALLKRRLENRLAALEEEHQQSLDRLRRIEGHQAAQEKKWKEEESSLQKQNDDLSALLTEMNTRRTLLEEEIADREAEALRMREERQKKADQLVQARMMERERDLENSRREIEAQEAELERERQLSVQELTAQADAIKRQIASKRRARDAQIELNNELELKLSSLKGELERKKVLQERCLAAEERVSMLERRHQDLNDEIQALSEHLQKKDAEVTELQAVAQRLVVRAEEERRLRTHVAELAREVNDTQAAIEAEKALFEQREREREAELEMLQIELKAAMNETIRVKENGALEIETLSRRCAALRQEVTEKQLQLSTATNEHAAKQAAIAQFEEEKRRLEREQLARKAAAAHAAKTALSELSY